MIILQVAIGIILAVVLLSVAPFIIGAIALTVMFISQSIYDLFCWFRRKVRYLLF